MADVFLINTLNPELVEAAREQALKTITEVVPRAYVFEVGSTAVDGLIGKQDLDFLVRVPAEEFEPTRDALDRHFDRNTRQLSNGEYQGYVVDSSLDVAIQLTIADGPYDTFLEFLDLLRRNEALRARYNRLKRSFHGRPMTEYRDAKRRFIEAALRSGDVLD